MNLNENKKSKQTIGLLCVLTSTTMYALMPVISKLGYAAGLNQYSLLVGRFMAAVAMYILIILAKRESAKVTPGQFGQLMLMSAISLSSVIFYFTSVNYLPAGMASLFNTTYVIFVVLIEMILRITKAEKYKFIVLGMAFIGIVIILWTPEGAVGISTKGMTLGLIGAFCYAVHIFVFNGKNLRELPLEVVFLYVITPALIVYPIMGKLAGLPILPVGLEQWGYAILLSVLTSYVAMVAFYTAVRLIGAGNSALIGTLEPFFACIFGAIFMNEVLTGRSAAGGLCIIGAIFILNFIENKRQSQK